MASPLAHIAIGASVAVLFAPRRAPRGFFWAAIVISLLPDAILNFSDDWSRLLTKPVWPEAASSVLVALLVGLLVTALFLAFHGRPRFGHLNTNGHGLRAWRGIVLFAAIYLSSSIVNGFAGEPLYFWWPFEQVPYVDGAAVIAPWFPNPLNWKPMLSEIFFVVLPSLLLAALVALFRERIGRPPAIPSELDQDETGKRLAR